MSIALAAAVPGGTAAKTETGAELSLSTAAATSPFQTSNGSSGSVSAAVNFSPWISLTDAETKLRLSGDVRVTEYARTFPRTSAFRVNANGSWQVDPRLSLSSDLSYGESVVGETNLVENLTPGIILVEDPTVIGFRTRNRSLNTAVTAAYRPDARQSWTLNVSATDSRFSNLASGGSNFAIYGGTVRYDRSMRRATLGLSIGLQRYECRSLPACSQVITSPQLTASFQLSPFWTLSGAAGASYVTSNQFGLQGSTLTPSINGSLCRRAKRANICLNASHTVEATALQGARPIFAGSLSVNYRVTERNSISFAGNYAGSSDTASSRPGLPSTTFSSFGARLSDEHLIRRNLHVVVTGSHSIARSSFVGQRANSEVSIGLRLSLGRGA